MAKMDSIKLDYSKVPPVALQLWFSVVMTLCFMIFCCPVITSHDSELDH